MRRFPQNVAVAFEIIEILIKHWMLDAIDIAYKIHYIVENIKKRMQKKYGLMRFFSFS